MRFKLITAQTSWSVTLSDVKDHLRVDSSDDEDLIQDLIYAVEAMIYEQYDMSLNQEVWEAYLDDFPDGDGIIEIYKWPIASIDSVKYTDSDGNTQTVDSDEYSTSVVGKPARIHPDESYTWPDVKDTLDAVQIRFTTGFTHPSVIPYDLKQAIYLVIADWYDNRTDSPRRLPQASHRVFAKYAI